MDFKNWSFRRKFLFFGLFAFLPWLIQTAHFYHKNWPIYRDLQAETGEVSHFPLYLKLLNYVQQHRSLVYWYYRGDFPEESSKDLLRDRIVSLEKEFLEFIHDRNTLSRLSHGPFEKNFFEQLERRFQRLRLENFSGTPEKSFLAHSEVILSILHFMRTEGERYRLFYDPDLRIRGLSELALLRIPYFVESVEQLSGVAVASLRQGLLLPQDQEKLFRFYARVLGSRALIDWSLSTLPVSSSTNMQYRTAQEFLNGFLAQIESMLKKRNSLRESVSYRELMAVSDLISDSYYALFQQIVGDLETLLKRKKHELLAEWGWQGLAAFVLYAVFIALFLLFYRELALKLALVHEGARRMAAGDLDYPIPVDSRDEIGTIARVLNQSMERIRAQLEEIYHLYYHDTLTGLPNRAKLLEDLRRIRHPIIFLLDLQAFRDLNLVYGTERGDELLKAIAQRLRRELPHPVYRMEADEFVILGDWKGEVSQAREFFEDVQGVVADLEKYPLLPEDEIFVDFRGVAVYCEKPREKLLIYAYEVLREKASSLQKFFLVPFLEEEKPHEENLFWIRITREALKEKKVRPFYQPICSLADGRAHKFEALVRIVQDDGTIIPPVKFLPLAQRVGLYPQITKAVIEQALADFRDLPASVSINLSFQDFLVPDLESYLLDTMERFGFAPEKLTLEIVETEEISDWDRISQILKNLKARGVSLAVDDFGTGYSNLNRLIELEVDYLKIDGSLIRHLPEDEKTRLLVAAILDFARKAGIKTVAEFVSGEDILRIVREMGIDYGQGYFFGAPKDIWEIRREWFSSS